MQPGTLRLVILLTGALLAAGMHAQGVLVGAKGTTLYVNRTVAAPRGDVSLGALVRSSGTLSPAEQEALSRSVTVLGDGIQLVPASQYQGWIETAFGPDAIIVGSRTVLIPKGSSGEGAAYLLDRLADYLIAQKLVSDGRVEMTFTQVSLKGAVPQDGTPSYQVVKSARGVDVSFLLTGSSGDSVSGRVTLPAVDAVARAQSDVKSSSPVRVVFRRGPVTVEVPGRTLGAASIGENVKVSIAENQKTFTGRLIEGKAVQVDLP